MNVAQYNGIATDFINAAKLAGALVSVGDIEVQCLPAPHRPPSALPKGKAAVYVFMFGSRCLKVGKAGPKSAARFSSQHYGVGRAPSTLAASVIKAGLGAPSNPVTPSNVSAWLRSNTTRIHFLLPSSYGPAVLALLEAFVQCRLRPEFEGFASQHGVQQFVQADARKTRAA